MKQCEAILDHIYEFILQHDITFELKDEIERHLELCRGCFTRYEFEQKLLARLKASSSCQPPESLKIKVQKITEKF